MIPRHLRHLRVFLAVARERSVTRAAERCNVSQPAVTQALARLEAEAGGPLFTRTRQGLFTTPRGDLLQARVERMFAFLDPALADIEPRLRVTATSARLQALIAVAEGQNFTLAARGLGLSQPTVHRAVAQLEEEAGRALFERTSFGVLPTRRCAALARAARLAFAELDQAEADLRELDGRDGGRIVVGALPLSRSVVLPGALAAFRRLRERQPVTVLDGPYDEMLGGLRRGEIDFMLGALRDPLPIGDVVQERLFDDSLRIVARPGHPVIGPEPASVAALARWSWVVPRRGTPTRAQFDAVFAVAGVAPPEGVVECGSILLMRELLTRGDMIGCISARQAEAEIGHGLLAAIALPGSVPDRPIGLTFRSSWQPTRAQGLMLDLIRAEAAALER
jgi:DNA-binding transcriptional LysR family regulator